MKKKPAQTPTQKQYNRRSLKRKICLHALLVVAFILVLIQSSLMFVRSFADRLSPQVGRAVIQVSRLLPQLEQNETMLRDAYDKMIQSWEQVFDKETAEYKDYISQQDAQYEDLVTDTLSWMNRVTKLKVGRDGFMFVVSKETNRILAHPNEDYVGRQFSSTQEIAEDDLISIKSIYLLFQQIQLVKIVQ